MNTKKWKMGLVVSLIIGFFTACAAAAVLDLHVDLKFILFFLGLVGKDVVLYLKEHPVESIKDDTSYTTKVGGWLMAFGISVVTLVRTYLVLVLLWVGLGVAFIHFTACKTPPQNIAYKAEGVVITTVDSTMKAWADFVRTHDVPQSQIDAVHQAYDKYYSAQLVARAAMETWVASKTEASATEWKTANADTVTAAQALIDVVKGFLK